MATELLSTTTTTTTQAEGSMLLCRITGAQLLAAVFVSKGKLCNARYLLSLHPEAESQRFLWIHGERWIPSYTEKIQMQRWDVILLSPHHRCPTPQTRWPPHPPLPGLTDGCPSQTPLHAHGGTRGSGLPVYFNGWGGWEGCRRALSSTAVCCSEMKTDFTLCFRREGRSCAWCHASPAPKVLVWERCGFDWPELPATAAQRQPQPGCMHTLLLH